MMEVLRRCSALLSRMPQRNIHNNIASTFNIFEKYNFIFCCKLRLQRHSHTTNTINEPGYLNRKLYFCDLEKSNIILLRCLKNKNTQYFCTGRRYLSGQKNAGGSEKPSKNLSTVYYLIAFGVFWVGLSYAAVPLYRIFCQATGLGGTILEGHDASKVDTMQRIEDRQIKIRFNADISSSMQWNFRPQQLEIKVSPGETALAFYTAKNPSDKPVIGISTYNVVPFEAGQYFNKIQCFCFEEQMLNPHEEVSMPVFFYIDPEFADDPKMEFVDQITLSYTFFEAKEGLVLPVMN